MKTGRGGTREVAGKGEWMNRQGRMVLHRGEHPTPQALLAGGWASLADEPSVCPKTEVWGAHIVQPHLSFRTQGPLPPQAGTDRISYASVCKSQAEAPGEALCSEHPRHSCSASRGPAGRAEPLRPDTPRGSGRGHSNQSTAQI